VIAENPTHPPATGATPQSGFLSKSTIKPGRWYGLRPRPEEPSFLGSVVKTLIGVAIGGLVFALGATKLAILIWVVSVIVGLVSLSSQKARSGVARFFAALGRGLGWLIGTVLLAPVFLVGFTIAHFVGRLAGKDPLHLRDTDSQTFWLPADQDRRTVRHIRSLYATETPVRTGRLGVVIASGLFGLLLIGEILARSLGFGNPILYRGDSDAGYLTAPNQETLRYGGNIKLNSYGMRAPEMERTKKPGALRIFMIGDSTLWGGSYVDQADIYARVLDDKLDKTPGANDVEIWNIGVNGWGPHEELGYVNKFGVFDADVAVVCLPIGDIYRSKKTLANMPYFSADAPPNFGLQEIGHHLLWRGRMMLKGPQKPEVEEQRGRDGLVAYAELAKKLQSEGCEVIFAVLPGRAAGMTSEAPEKEQEDVERLRAALAPLGVEVDYPVGLFKDKGTTGEMYFDVCHLYTKGNHAYADYLKTRLEELSTKIREHRAQVDEKAAPQSIPAPAPTEGSQQ
jgi:hypothetical protein